MGAQDYIQPVRCGFTLTLSHGTVGRQAMLLRFHYCRLLRFLLFVAVLSKKCSQIPDTMRELLLSEVVYGVLVLQ